VAAVIYAALLEFADQRILAPFASDVSAKEKIMDLGSPVESSREHVLHVIEEALRDQRLVVPGIVARALRKPALTLSCMSISNWICYNLCVSKHDASYWWKATSILP